MRAFLLLPSFKFLFILILISNFSVYAQEDDKIIEAYKDYTDASREIVYLHLNKSTYVIGETIGFTAYVLNKKDRKPSLHTTNLYISVEDNKQNIVKQKLIMVNNGIASNTFEVDSLFSDGNYHIKAYTNWMRNFNEQNYFVESIKIKDLKIKDNNTFTSNSIDAQFLPESGHLLNGVENNIGVVIKDSNGYGIPYATGEVLDKNGSILTTFKTNKLGIGRFSLIADINNKYKINISNANKVSSFNLNQNIENNGVILSVKRLKEKLFISAITNAGTLNSIKNKRYALLLHNGETSDLMDIYFTDDTKVTKIVELNGSPGINILTLFNENNQPIAERLVFNYEGISILKSDVKTLETKTADSLSININFKSIDTTQAHNISISVLPKGTKSYKRHHNFISYIYLQPYINEAIENGKYYFTDISEKKKFELDNLLITQGWSSYSWDNIFKGSPKISHYFEQGITVKANSLSKHSKETNVPNRLMYYLNEGEGFMISELKQEKSSHLIEYLFPEDNNTLKLSEVAIKSGIKPAQMYLQFFPNKIPLLNRTRNTLLNVNETILDTNYDRNNVAVTSSKNAQILDEIVVKSNTDQNELSSGRFGKESIIDEKVENTYPFLRSFLETKGMIVDDSNAGLRAYFPGSAKDSFIGGGIGYLVFFLDDMLLIDTSILTRYSMSNIDYVEINRQGTSEGLRAPNGYVKIYTKKSGNKHSSENTKAYEFPLTFSKQKKFYAPKYKYYNDDFYKNYGTIEWKPNLTVDANGNITVKITKPEVPITLFIEGIANDGTFISEEKSVEQKDSE